MSRHNEVHFPTDKQSAKYSIHNRQLYKQNELEVFLHRVKVFSDVGAVEFISIYPLSDYNIYARNGNLVKLIVLGKGRILGLNKIV